MGKLLCRLLDRLDHLLEAIRRFQARLPDQILHFAAVQSVVQNLDGSRSVAAAKKVTELVDECVTGWCWAGMSIADASSW